MKLEDYKSGMYTRVNDVRAFILTRLDYDWEWQDSKLSKLLGEASRQIGEINMYTLLTKEIDKYIKMQLKLEAINSCFIEGIDVKIEELLDDKTEDEEKNQDIKEVKSYIDAMNYGADQVREGQEISTNLIKEIHKILLEGTREESQKPGELRTSQICVEKGFEGEKDFVPSAHTEIIECLADFEKFAGNNETELSEIIKIALLHYQFESIRPFSAGNGSTGRIIIPLYLQNKKIVEKSCLYMSNYFRKNKEAYLRNLTKVRTNGDIVGWVRFFLEAVIETTKNQKEQYRKLYYLEEEISEIIKELPVKEETSKKVIEDLYNAPITSRKKILENIDVKPSTLNTTINSLLEKGILVETTGQGRNQVFAFQKYIDIFTK